jgi:hypothetical protein
LAYFRPFLRLWFLLTNCLNPWQKHDPAYFGNWPPWPVRSTSNPQAHSHLHQPNLAPPQCTPNWYASQAQEESSTWSITIGKLHNHTSTTHKKRLTMMYHRNEFVFMVLPCYPIFSPVHVLLFPTYQGTSFSYYFFLVISLAILACVLLLKNISRVNSDSVCLLGGAFVCLMCQCALPELSPKLLAQSSVSAASSFRWCTTSPHTLHHWSIPITLCFFVSQTQIEKNDFPIADCPLGLKNP